MSQITVRFTQVEHRDLTDLSLIENRFKYGWDPMVSFQWIAVGDPVDTNRLQVVYCKKHTQSTHIYESNIFDSPN